MQQSKSISMPMITPECVLFMDCEELEKERGIDVMLTSVQPKVLAELRRGGLLDIIGEDYVFDSAEYAILKAHEEIEEENSEN